MTNDFPSSSESKQLALQLRALAHPVRLKVLETLARHETCMCGEIVAGLPLAQSTVSQHIKVLAEAGLIRAEADGPRFCYCIDHEALDALQGQLDGLFAALAPSSMAVPTAALLNK